MRNVLVLLATVTVLVFPGCSSGSAPASEPRPVASDSDRWRAARSFADPSPPWDAAAGRGCKLEDLETVVNQNGGGGWISGGVVFRNRSATPCYLSGFPGPHVYDADGVEIDGFGQARPGKLDPPSVPVLLKVGTPPLKERTRADGWAVAPVMHYGRVSDCANSANHGSRVTFDLPNGGGTMEVEALSPIRYCGGLGVGAFARSAQ